MGASFLFAAVGSASRGMRTVMLRGSRRVAAVYTGVGGE